MNAAVLITSEFRCLFQVVLTWALRTRQWPFYPAGPNDTWCNLLIFHLFQPSQIPTGGLSAEQLKHNNSMFLRPRASFSSALLNSPSVLMSQSLLQKHNLTAWPALLLNSGLVTKTYQDSQDPFCGCWQCKAKQNVVFQRIHTYINTIRLYTLTNTSICSFLTFSEWRNCLQ